MDQLWFWNGHIRARIQISSLGPRVLFIRSVASRESTGLVTMIITIILSQFPPGFLDVGQAGPRIQGPCPVRSIWKVNHNCVQLFSRRPHPNCYDLLSTRRGDSNGFDSFHSFFFVCPNCLSIFLFGSGEQVYWFNAFQARGVHEESNRIHEQLWVCDKRGRERKTIIITQSSSIRRWLWWSCRCCCQF